MSKFVYNRFIAHMFAFGWCLSTFWRWHIYMSWLFWLILRVYDIKNCSSHAFFDFNKSFLSKLAASSRSGGEIAILGIAGNVLKSDDTLTTNICSAAKIVPMIRRHFFSFNMFLLITQKMKLPNKAIFDTSTNEKFKFPTKTAKVNIYARGQPTKPKKINIHAQRQPNNCLP